MLAARLVIAISLFYLAFERKIAQAASASATGVGGRAIVQREAKAMAKWNSAEWASLRSGEACPICRQGKPNGIVLELTTSYLTSSADSPIRGYCCLVLKRHAVELHDLREEEAVPFMQDVRRVGRALQEVTKAVKLNYEIHGNTVPHLHVHLYPRYQGDPFEGRSIEPSLITTSPYQGTEFRDFVVELQRKVRDP